MSILSGYKRFKKYLRTGEDYRLCSEWTKSDSVEMIDGGTLQESLDNVVHNIETTQNDITDVHNELKTSLGGMTFGVDAAGRYGYIKAGADTVTPFKKNDWETLSTENIKEFLWSAGPHQTFSKNPSFTFRSPSAGQIASSLGIKDQAANVKIIGVKKVTATPRPGYGGISSVYIDANTGSGGTVVVNINSDGDMSTVGATAGVSATILLYVPS